MGQARDDDKNKNTSRLERRKKTGDGKGVDQKERHKRCIPLLSQRYETRGSGESGAGGPLNEPPLR